jgi:hypothetical protein
MHARSKLLLPLCCAALAVSLAAARMAAAVNLPDLGNVNVPGTSYELDNSLGGMIVVDEWIPLDIDMGASGSFTGWLQNRVVEENGTHKLAFYYRIVSDSTSTLTLNTLADYFPSLPSAARLDVGYRTDGLGTVAPNTAERDGRRVVFHFNTPIGPGQSSRFFYIRTDATSYEYSTEVWAVGELGGLVYQDVVGTYGPVL